MYRVLVVYCYLVIPGHQNLPFSTNQMKRVGKLRQKRIGKFWRTRVLHSPQVNNAKSNLRPHLRIHLPNEGHSVLSRLLFSLKTIGLLQYLSHGHNAYCSHSVLFTYVLT